MATERDVARLRQKYTGESRAVALEWHRNNGLQQGLVPDAADWVQELLEAGVLRALMRPVLHTDEPASTGTLAGVVAASPSAGGLTLWVRESDVPLVLARLLPVQVGPDLSGVPWLRAWASADQDLRLGLIGRSAHITVRVQHTSGTGRTARAWAGRASEEDLERAAASAGAAGGRPVWDEPLPQRVEGGPLELLSRPFAPGEAARWSRALRRAGLFLERVPDWRSRPPAAEELEGPSPARLQPRAVGPAGTSGGGVVAVTSADGRGGYGCTTTAVVLAGALARSGNRVLVLGDEEPSNVLRMFGHQPPPTFTGRGRLNLGILPDDPAEAWEMISQARQWEYDVVVLDPGFQRRHLADGSDLILAMMTDRPQGSGGSALWTYTEVIDRRPQQVQMLQWLDEQLAGHPSQELSPLETLMTFLDLMFGVYSAARSEDGEASVYDASDPDEVEEWWGDFHNVLHWGSPDLDDTEDDEEGPGSAPAGDAASKVGVDLDVWRADFIRFLDHEGRARHPEHWPQATAGWAERHRQRQREGLAPGDMSEDEWWVVLKEFFANVEERAVERWGLSLWEEHRARWAAAVIRDEDLFAPFEGLVEYNQLPRQAAVIAQDLAGEVRGLPPAPVLGVLGRSRHAIDAGQLNETAAAITQHGLSGLMVLPELHEWGTLWGNPAGLASPSPRAAAASLALARSVTEQLPQRPKGERA